MILDIILASASPRRRELLSVITKDFRVFPSDAEEILPEGTEPLKSAEILSEIKAKALMGMYPDSLIIGADTAVILGEKILGKPKDCDDAFKMLKSLSGKTHTVITGCTLIYKEKTVSFTEKTEVEFFPLSDNEILEYIKTGSPFDKAGSYGIQDQGSLFVKRISGDFYNVIGLPIARLKREIENITK